MIVNRRTFISRPGQAEKVAEVIKSGIVFTPFQPPFRIYISETGTFWQVVLEVEFKDLAEYERFWAGVSANAPESWWQAWFAATDNGGTNEIWRLVE